jgi:hypothetical protein
MGMKVIYFNHFQISREPVRRTISKVFINCRYIEVANTYGHAVLVTVLAVQLFQAGAPQAHLTGWTQCANLYWAARHQMAEMPRVGVG